MDNNIIETDESPLSLYLDYDFLPVLQQASILKAIGGLYEVILADTSSGIGQYPIWVPIPWSSAIEDSGLVLRPVFGPPLVISSVETVSSLTYKFKPEVRWFPHIRYSKDGLEVMLPRWTAVAVLVGATLTFGLGKYEQFLDVQKHQLEIEKLRIEIQQLKPERRESDPRIQLLIQDFRIQTSTPNIRRTELNGVPTKRHE
jgi:hypothetical protein